MNARVDDLMHACIDGEAGDAGRRELEGAIERDPALRDDFERLQAMARMLAEVPEVAPPAGLQTRILSAHDARARAARQLSAPPAVFGGRPNPLRRLFGFIQSEKETFMSEVQKGFLSSTRSRVLAGGAIAAIAVVVISTQVGQPEGGTAGTIVPA
ncbi:MAG TPA: hypothetical protein VIE63_03495, partial [Ramlibacter sp.]